MFFVGANLCFLLLQMLACLSMIPNMFNGIQALWLLLIIVPLFTLSFMANPSEPKIMDHLSGIYMCWL